jgi:hypothetical protein
MFVNRRRQNTVNTDVKIPSFIFSSLGIVVAEVGDANALHLALFIEVIKDPVGDDIDITLPSFSD